VKSLLGKMLDLLVMVAIVAAAMTILFGMCT
jgi:hypothetical protein